MKLNLSDKSKSDQKPIYKLITFSFIWNTITWRIKTKIFELDQFSLENALSSRKSVQPDLSESDALETDLFYNFCVLFVFAIAWFTAAALVQGPPTISSMQMDMIHFKEFWFCFSSLSSLSRENRLSDLLNDLLIMNINHVVSIKSDICGQTNLLFIEPLSYCSSGSGNLEHIIDYY